ncbi:unnamed protein product, partial [Cylicostephanus goldi]
MVIYDEQYLYNAVVENKTLFVNSNVPVSLIATNSLTEGRGEDKFVVLPICQLGREYHIVGEESFYEDYQSTNIFTIIAVEDNTTVTLEFFFLESTLNRGQQLTIITTDWANAVVVTSNKNVAVLSGSVCGYGNTYSNHPSQCSYEALMLAPSSNWGKEAPFYKYLPEDSGEFMLFFEEANTDVYFDEQKLSHGPFGSNSYLTCANKTGVYIRATGPIYVVA